MLHTHFLPSSDNHGKSSYCVRLRFICLVSCKMQLQISMCYITTYYTTTSLFGGQVCATKRERSGPCYLTLTPCMASHNPTDVFSSSYRLSWWNICSVVNGFIVSPRNWDHIAVKCIDLFFEWRHSSLLCNSASVTVCTVSGVHKSGHHQWFYPFFPSWTSFFFLGWTIHLCQDRSFSSLCQPLSVFTEPLNNDPHNSLHEPLTEENKTLLLT